MSFHSWVTKINSKITDHQFKTDTQVVLNMNITPSIQSSARSLYENAKWIIVVYSVISVVYVASIPRTWIWFNWHPLSMIVAFILLSSFAALIKKIGGYENTKLHGN